MPNIKTDFFTGREAVLDALHHALQSGHAAALTQAISGLGGIGKTQTALEYAHRYGDEYAAVFWLRADSADELRQSLANMTTLLKLPEKDAQDKNQQIAAALRWLQQHSGWLLIGDNADFSETWTPADMKQLLPTHANGRLLLTSRAQDFEPLLSANPIELHPMTPQEADEFLWKRVVRDRDAATQAERDAAADIAKELGYLPLALEQAGAYVRAKKQKFAVYLGEYQKRAKELLQQAQPRFGAYHPDRDTGEYHTVWTTWDLNFEVVRATNAASAELLTFSAFLAPAPIPCELLTEGASALGDTLSAAFAATESGEAVYDDLLKPLTDYSLVRKDIERGTYTMHRLVQLVLRDRLPEKEQKQWRARVVNAVFWAFGNGEFENWPNCEHLMPHGLLSAETIAQDGMISREAWMLLNNLGYYLTECAQYAEAERLSQQALHLRRNTLSEDDPDLAYSLNNLAELYRTQGHYTEAEPLYQQALAIWQQAYGPAHPLVATMLSNLAALYHVQYRYDKAKPLYEQALALRRKILPTGHPDLAYSLNNLAGVYISQARYAEAESLYQQALAIWQQAHGATHPLVALTLHNLATLYRRRSEYNKAESFHQQALALRRKMLPTGHPSIAQSLNSMAFLYYSQGRYEKALLLMEEALAMRYAAFGELHPEVAQSYVNCAVYLRALNRETEAQEMDAHAAAIRAELARREGG